MDSDLTQVNIIAFRRMNQLDLSGNVITPHEFLSTLKVCNTSSYLPTLKLLPISSSFSEPLNFLGDFFLVAHTHPSEGEDEHFNGL